MRKNYLGDIIFKARKDAGLTQDQYGAKYELSGPAIFKFEKGYVFPTLSHWMMMAADAAIPERRAVLLWARSKLPEKYQEYIELQGVAAAESGEGKTSKTGKPDYSKFETREEMRAAADKDRSLPEGLRKLLDDDELWSLYRPTGHEINMLRDVFGPLGKGSVVQYREALRLVREFSHAF